MSWKPWVAVAAVLTAAVAVVRGRAGGPSADQLWSEATADTGDWLDNVITSAD